jgi:hypothetical protein
MRTDTRVGRRFAHDFESSPVLHRCHITKAGRPGRINLLCVPGAPGRGPRRLVQLDMSFGVQARRGEPDRAALRRPPTLTRSS